MTRASHLDGSATYIVRDARIAKWRRALIALVRNLRVWRERSRQRSELAALVRDGFDCKDFGVTSALATREANKFPWQDFEQK